MTPEMRGVVRAYRNQLAYYRGLQQVAGSNWTDAMVAKAMAPHRADVEHALYRHGFTRDQVAEALADPSPGPRPARTISEHMNRLIRGGRT